MAIATKPGYVYYLNDVGIINTTAIPDKLDEKIKHYSGWKIANIDLNNKEDISIISKSDSNVNS